MSEYQYYEFLAIDRPLTGQEQDDIRSLSSRARITATSFTNEYHWGDFHGDTDRLMQRYYDAHLYVANWGTRRVMFRLPSALLDSGTADAYCIDDYASAQTSGKFTVLDFTSERDDLAEDFDVDIDENGSGLLSAVVGVRAELADGDLRPLYLAWLGSCSNSDLDEDLFTDDLEPPLPPGLATLTAAQTALAHFLRVDEELLTVAAEISPPVEPAGDVLGDLADWIQRLPDAEKNQHLLGVMQGDASRVGAALRRQFRDASSSEIRSPSRRPVAALFEAAEHRRKEHARRAAAKLSDAKARREQQRATARAQRLDSLAEEGDAVWFRVDGLITTRKPLEYDAALDLLTDLQSLAEREGRMAEFSTCVAALRHKHARKVSMMERLDKANIQWLTALG